MAKLMPDLIREALDVAIQRFESIDFSKSTKLDIESLSIEGVSPSDLVGFMNYNNVPGDCWFSVDVKQNTPLLSWNASRPLNESEEKKERARRFEDYAWCSVRDTLLSFGYRRVEFNSSLLKGKNPYEMYLRGDTEALVAYYSMYFGQ